MDAGQVTLMFTDIEGSTRLIDLLGDGYSPLLLRHQEIVRAATNRFNGEEDGTQGDSFFIMFQSAAEGFAAAVEIHRALESEPWTRGVQVRVRIGLHQGTVKVVQGRVVGLDVHRAARIASAGHGGQSVLSESVVQALTPGDVAASNVSLRALGSHRLKDIRYPEKLWDIVDTQVESLFPPLRSMETRPTNIASPRGPIIGRERELGELSAALSGGEDRLITIVGTGGTGKSSVAQRTAALLEDQFPDGVYLVDLGPVSEGDLVFPTIAQALGIRDFPGRPVVEDIASSIQDGRQLLILDTFEHVLDAGTGVAHLIAQCPNLRILVTSRAELGLSIERPFRLDPLALPKAGDPAPEESGAMRLFVERVQEALPDFVVDASNRETVVDIVRRLEGVPLALELAAARLGLMTPKQLLGRLDARFKLLRSSRRDLDRHKTLRDAIEWSDNLLSEEERDVFQRLSVFVGGFKLEDAENVLYEVDGLDADILETIASLTSKSLLFRRLEHGEPRFDMFDMIREYATDTLTRAGTRDETECAFVAHYAALAEECGPKAMTRGQLPYVTRLAEEADNLRAALRAGIDRGDAETVARIVDALFWYWISQGQFTEGLRWIGSAVSLADRQSGTAAEATIHFAAAYLKVCAGDYGGGRPHGERAKEIRASLGDKTGEKDAALVHALCCAAEGSMEDPSAIILDSIEQMRAVGNYYAHAVGLIILGEGTRMEGDKETAEGCYREAIGLLDRIENTFWPGLLKQNIGHFRLAEGKLDEAAGFFAEAHDLGEDFDYPIVVHLSVAGFGGLALARGDARLAARLLGGVDSHMERIGASFEPTDKADIDGYVAGARAALGDAAYDASAAEGAQASWETLRREARALGDSEPEPAGSDAAGEPAATTL
ncbi:MAG: adenylate/guanylate cyclase domain-containing protein [Pseudomonadota bacterium]